MTNFDTILKDWQAGYRDEETWPDLNVPDTELLAEFCFFCAEHKEARGRNSAFNEQHLIRLFSELKRRQLFPE